MSDYLKIMERHKAAMDDASAAFDSMVEMHDAECDRRRDAERTAARLSVQLASATARVAELEAALDVEPCADCGECKDEKPAPYHCDRCGADFDAPVDHGDGWDRCPECGTN